MAKTKATKSTKGFSDEERAAMKERAQELKAEALKADGTKALLAQVAKMPPADRAMAKRLHEIVSATAPSLTPKTWYGMPAYADENGKVVCYFKGAYKFNQRYAQFGFEDAANLDDGAMWPVVFALTKLTPADEKKIAALVKKSAR
jgi:uncharacterized protein YdhG (YjbR/CyaY superfamily)